MDLIVTGRISGTFGIEGFMKVVSSSGEYDHFFNLKKVYVTFFKQKLRKNKFRDGWFNIENVRLIPSCVLLKFEGIDVVEDARFFVGGNVQVPKSEACSLFAGEFYACDLCLCSLTLNGSPVGKIVNVVDGAGALLEVVKNDGKICYIPFNNEFIGMVSIEEKLVELKNEWILE